MNLYKSPEYKLARVKAFARSKGTCQLCGHFPAVEAHHWARVYPQPKDHTSNDLIALCNLCHFIATTIRRFLSAGGKWWYIKAALKESIDKCYTKSKSKELHRSSCMMDGEPLTKLPLRPLKKQLLQRNGDQTEQHRMKQDFENSNASLHSGTTTEFLQSLQE